MSNLRPVDPDMRFRMFRLGVGAYRVVEAGLVRAHATIHHGACGFLSTALSDDERTRLGPSMYDRYPSNQRTERDLFAWEREWFRRDLPRPPAHVLVGGAGHGREAVALDALGYQVTAFEPAPQGSLQCAAALAGRGQCTQATYQDLARAVLDGAQGPLAAVAQERFDAVLFGWGSFSHLLTAIDQERALRAAASLTNGPILASFFLGELTPEPYAVRAFELGATAGRRVGHGHALDARGLMFRRDFGLAKMIADADLTRLAAAVGRRVTVERDGYAHATFS